MKHFRMLAAGLCSAVLLCGFAIPAYGHTGTDANRENFQRLLSDVMSGKINCVVVKDLSRFARNYSDAGSLIDNQIGRAHV